ncbi:hypothetical protein LPJ78_002462 [Coemansia sp. RSA 989]|nr:zinc-finger domain of monoamine-oxidase A repressor R1-domain-containing protein [Coemansia mojavensis]KAJ1742585.1 hypothetical protein LPJ68_001807 [Coemansia sp. RSA 1086]KAJ1865682.1 hypothetical protein LPJ78_002462 [Coemansia sp. RSA 989]KAJ1872931.1 hypothetical protein LPJ55_002731 [Coemansia sp. RSA 990]KAJ2630573.1 hypothetical protein H4R22_002574 [Coemansia sp. RSA 1290]KAJ2647755.1 hypothetical protein IWW40_004478 [Coemansia sp. RSA 1250]
MASYEEEREQQIRANAEFLASLGIEKLCPKKQPKRRKAKDEDEYLPVRSYDIRDRSKRVSYSDDYKSPPRYKRAKSKQSKPSLRRSNPGRRIVGGRVYDSTKGRTCHQCRQKTMDDKMVCTNDHCTLMMDYTCLLNRYNEHWEQLDHSTWTCPKCRNICNCSFCMKKRGKAPTGQLSTFIKLNGIEVAKSTIGAEDISQTVFERSKPVRNKFDLVNQLYFEGCAFSGDESDDDTLTEAQPSLPQRSSKRLANSDTLQKVAQSMRFLDDDLEWHGWSSCPRHINCIVLIEN